MIPGSCTVRQDGCAHLVVQSSQYCITPPLSTPGFIPVSLQNASQLLEWAQLLSQAVTDQPLPGFC